MTPAIEVIGSGGAAAADSGAPRALAGKALFRESNRLPSRFLYIWKRAYPRSLPASPAQRLTRRDLLPRRLGIVIDARRYEPNRSGLAIPHRQTIHISSRLRGPHGDAGSLSIYRLPARRSPLQIFSAMRVDGVLLSIVVPA